MTLPLCSLRELTPLISDHTSGELGFASAYSGAYAHSSRPYGKVEKGRPPSPRIPQSLVRVGGETRHMA